MAGRTAALLSPRRLVVWYLVLALVGLLLMLTAGPPNTGVQPSPIVGSPPPTIAAVDN